MERKTCKTCKYFKEFECDNGGNCNFMPPVLIIDKKSKTNTNIRSKRPYVCEDDIACSKHEDIESLSIDRP